MGKSFFFCLCLVLASTVSFKNIAIPHNGCLEKLIGKWIIYTMDEETFYPLDSDEDEDYLGKMIEFHSNGEYEIFYDFSDGEREIDMEGYYSISADCKTITLDDDEFKIAISTSKLVLLVEGEVESDDDEVKTEVYEYAVFRRK